MPKNFGTLGAIVTGFLLVGHLMTSGLPFFSLWGWKLLGFGLCLGLSFLTFFYIAAQSKSPVIGMVYGGVMMAVLLVLLGTVT